MSRIRNWADNALGGAKKAIGAIRKLYASAPARFCFISALVLLLIIESLCRHSPLEAFAFIFKHPFMFFVDYLIVLFTLSLSWFLGKGIIMWLTFTLIWLGLSIANSVILLYRAAPLTGSDFAILKDVLPIIGVYLNVFQIALIIAAIVGAIALLVVLWIKAPSDNIDTKRGLTKFLVLTVLLGSVTPTLAVTGVLPRDFSDINRAYKDFGFPYGFVCSVFVHGISEPKDYGPEEINSILERIEAGKKEKPPVKKDGRPNVIYVQLESFFDINYVKHLELAEDPIPNFTALKEKYPHGYLNVPLVGAGTANTEFEILTGMNLDYFGAGDYPYTLIFDEHTGETVAYALANHGYRTHAMHNNTGTFYTRDIVYANLGFDTFSPIENMYGVEYNPLDWAKDTCLFPQIRDTLLSTENDRDFVFTVSVQAHGKYPTEYIPSEYGIDPNKVNGIEDEELKNMYLYYIDQINGTDKFIGELTAWLDSFSEPTVAVFYGDHLPYLELEDEDLVNGDLYQTEYIIYSNYEIEGERPEAVTMEAYQLNAFVFNTLGMDGGVMCDAHTYLSGEADYLDVLKTLEYDMMFGERYAYGERGAYNRKDMTYGIHEVKVDSVTNIVTGENGEKCVLTVKGNNFNPFSKIEINGKSASKTQFVDSKTLRVTVNGLKRGDRVAVVQQAENGTVFNRSNSVGVK